MGISITTTRMSLIFFWVLFALSYHSKADLIGDTCKKTLFPELCISTLRSAPPGSSTADLKELACIAFKATIVKVTNNLNLVDELLKNTDDDNVLKECLIICASNYEDVINDSRMGIQNVGPNNIQAAVNAANIIDEAWTCKEIFEDLKRKLTFATENEVVRQLTVILTTIVKSLG